MSRFKIILVAFILMFFATTNIWGVRLIDESPGSGPQVRKTKTAPAVKKKTAPRITEVRTTPQPAKTTAPAAREPAAAPAEPEEQYVTMDFDDVDVRVFIKFIADVTKRNFIIDDKVKGKVTVISPRRMTIDEAYQVFLSVLEVNGFGTVTSGNVSKVVRSSEAITKSLETRIDDDVLREDRMATQIVPLKFADANDMRTLLSPLMSKGTSQLLAYPQSNLLLITDTMSNISKILDILKIVDVTGFAQEIRIIPLTNASATDMASKLTQILSEDKTPTRRTRVTGTVGSKAASKIIPDERTNSLIVLASAQDMQEIVNLIERLDIPTPTGKEDIHVYYLQYASAEDLASVLGDFPTPATAADSAKGAKTVSSSGQKIKISPDKDTNSLIIYADPRSYTAIVDTIKYLDIPRKQVYVKAVIMEVKTNKDFKVGVQWSAFEDFTYDSGDRKGGVFARTGSDFVSSLTDVPGGPVLGVVGQAIKINAGEDNEIVFPNMTSFINAMKQDTDVHILSTPQIITMDNKEAEIKVGANVPYVTREDTDSTNISRTVRTFDYRDVGVTLKLTPQINQEGNIRMDLFQEITTLVEGEGEDAFAPTTLKRSATTTVTVKDSSTMVIGGLIGDTLTLNNNRVPLLGDVPVLGWLFKTKSKKREKTNLYIFLTPVIIDSDKKANDLYFEKYGESKNVRDKFEPETDDENPES